MNTGGYSERLMINVKCFNGGLFKGIDPIALDVNQIQLLIDAASADWRYVEPAIFGTLLERALDPRERHKLGAHYTPRAYVERLVMPTLINPLRERWGDIRAAAETLLRQGKQDKALEEVQAFHFKLCQTRVLDPACGSANFLYVALEHMKRLEGEVLAFIAELSGGQSALDAEGLTVSPHQFLGLEINPRAAQIAELVLWIGYLQWHYRLNGNLNIPEPILKDFKNIECRDALIEYDSREPKLDAQGKVVTIWDGISMKVSPTTGNLIPDETGQATVYQYKNPRQTDWPKADYIIGNPPFIGASTMRRSLGDGYVDAVRKVYKKVVPESADFVMFWWHIAAEKVRLGEAFRFGFITTNSIKQTFNRRVIETHLSNAKKPLSILYAVPDHPWVDGNDGAAVRIAMTVGVAGNYAGQLNLLVKESSTEEKEARDVQLTQRTGKTYSDLTIGADVSSALALKANFDISNRGVSLFGSGFIITKQEANNLGLGIKPKIEKHIRDYRNGRDLLQSSRNVMVIDLYGLDLDKVRSEFPDLYQWVLERVKPERDNNKRASRRNNWWLFGETNPKLRSQLGDLPRYITTVETAKHRIFQFLDSSILPDNKLINIALAKAYYLGFLSSRIHTLWALANGSSLGATPVYPKTQCFETFPFPTTSPELSEKISELAESIDKHRKRQQAEYPNLTMTDMYNVLEKLRLGEELTAKEKTTHQQGLIALLAEYHDELDTAVFEAYGWTDLVEKLVGKPGATTPYPDKPTEQAEAEEELLMRLVALNKQRAEEEAKGVVRWLRPDYQAPDDAQEQTDLALETVATSKPKIVAAKDKATFPKTVPEQLKVLRETLAESSYTLESLADIFKRKPVKSIEEGLQSLVAVGLAEYETTTQTWHLV
ncbi:class I SAM-dependent DNA methyltransferase [Marinospirillum minutulum]|uniref:class I SAM-dependent DNA methyltransferase n=1 Tax=Marinospirillum minutulum TaxID=64974 RepID=UPI0003F61FC4|nr:class I SAM-dependent DNA methyltransferase [Marinospirillum minutulum]